MHQGSKVIVLTQTILTLKAIYLLYKNDHRYSNMFTVLLAIGYFHFVFCFLFIHREFWDITDTTPLNKLLNDGYTFPMMMYALTVGVLFASVKLERNSSIFYFGIYLFLILTFISIFKKYGSHFITEEPIIHNGFKTEDESVLYFTPKLLISKTESFTMKARVMHYILEYLFIYIPITISCYQKFKRTHTVRKWKNNQQEDICSSCHNDISLCSNLVIYFAIFIWFIRPFSFILCLYYNSERTGIFIRMVSVFFIFLYVLCCIIYNNSFRKRYNKTDSLNKHLIEEKERANEICCG